MYSLTTDYFPSEWRFQDGKALEVLEETNIMEQGQEGRQQLH
jgi:hypothetical protein